MNSRFLLRTALYLGVAIFVAALLFSFKMKNASLNEKASPVVISQAPIASSSTLPARPISREIAIISEKLPEKDAKLPTAADDIKSILDEKSTDAPVRAFSLIDRCVQASKSKKVMSQLSPNSDLAKAWGQQAPQRASEEQYCASVSQRQIIDRAKLLEAAIQAGVQGAAWLYYAAGPNGQPDDLITRADDLEIANWRQRAVGFLERDASKGDPNALAQLAIVYSELGQSPDLVKSLGYELALKAVDEQLNAINRKAGIATRIAMLKSQATPPQIADAERFASQFVNKKTGPK